MDESCVECHDAPARTRGLCARCFHREVRTAPATPWWVWWLLGTYVLPVPALFLFLWITR